jgi:hypothetical protein
MRLIEVHPDRFRFPVEGCASALVPLALPLFTPLFRETRSFARPRARLETLLAVDIFDVTPSPRRT